MLQVLHNLGAISDVLNHILYLDEKI